ncbi:Ig-like domain-containing protein [Ectothiorhodospira variabilis]|uniref:Ig-like domain-containing protein n=1 Tax=Ectothiorhodospira variabilis TaxID=505694 RepID=UPI001EFAED4E|nr:Ig-like domain-containing protein [Ectothiorhodospira variabilis]MCG5496884.1 Ig-like domain-containing protein [Ectothiorhodospira variabilis]
MKLNGWSQAKGSPIILIFLLILTACGGGDDNGFTNGDGPDENGAAQPDNDEPVIGRVVMRADSLQMDSAGSSPVTLRALVRDSNNVAIEDVPVRFFTNDSDSVIVVKQGVTDDTGQALAEISSETPALRTVIAGAEVRGSSDTVELNVVGNTLSADAPSAIGFDESATFRFRLTDSDGSPIQGRTIELTSGAGVVIEPETPETDSNGQASAIITPPAGTIDPITVTASSMGASVSRELSITSESLRFSVPDGNVERLEIPLNQSQDIAVRWQDAGVAIAGQQIDFSVTRGERSATSAITDADGEARISISANTAGPSLITATPLERGLSSQVEVLFVADNPDDLTLQADPAVIGVNSGDGTEQRSEIIARLRDPDGNLVKGQWIDFNLRDNTGGSLTRSRAETDRFGRATTTYIAGSASSGQDAVEITATVEDASVDPETAFLTVAGQPLFITLGTGNTTLGPDETKYYKPYTVLVTDVNGSPVRNKTVTIGVHSIAYRKGKYRLPNTEFADPNDPDQPFENPFLWFRDISARCEAEDHGSDGIFDESADDNNDGMITPGNIATLSAQSVRTDDSGFADFEVRYPKNYAGWVRVELTARASVQGTESVERARFWLPIPSDDIDDFEVEPPGIESPFGLSGTCADTE